MLPARVIDITGQKFGRLTAVSYGDGKWLCRCECGGETRTGVSKLRSGHSRSCGCLSTERIAAVNRGDRYCGACHCGDHVFAVLTRGFVGLLSPEDARWFASESWNAHRGTTGGWAVTGTHARKLHRVVLEVTDPVVVVDHRDGNVFDNRRHNIRVCDNARNVKNQRVRRSGKFCSRFKGVTRDGNSGSWRAQITADKAHYNLGSYATERAAALAYDVAALRLHGAFARTNAALGLL